MDGYVAALFRQAIGGELHQRGSCFGHSASVTRSSRTHPWAEGFFSGVSTFTTNPHPLGSVHTVGSLFSVRHSPEATRSNSADFNRVTLAKPDPGPARKLTEPSGVRFTVAHHVGLSADGEASCAIISKADLIIGRTLRTSAAPLGSAARR
jgi:hypothetical protein